MTGIQKLMEVLDLTEDEAKQLMADDEAIDKGEKLFELNADQKQVEKKMRQADRKVDAYGKTTKRERKVDDDKAFLLNELFKAILPHCDTYEIANGEREFSFTYHEKKYKVVLSAPRK
jgi:molecular chaperone GrpE (heat shock protein)